MATPITVNGYTFKELPAGGVSVSGPGISNGSYGIQVADSIATFSYNDLLSLNRVPGVNREAYNVLIRFTAQDIGNIKSGLEGPPNTDPGVPPATDNKPNSNDLGGTAGDEQNSYDKKEATNVAAKENNATATGSNEMETLNDSYAGKTQAGNAQSPAGNEVVDKGVGKTPKPGSRLQNPLGNFSSYTYQLTLYMITPDSYDEFQRSGRKNINALTDIYKGQYDKTGGTYIIAQSGGINNATSKRAPGFDLDFYIDDLKIKTAVNGKSTQSASNVTSLSFNIYEPYGFSFITRLSRAYNTLKKNSKLKDYDKATNGTKQFFILGIRFQGYDKNGNIANASQVFSDDTINTSPDASGVYERFYDILLTKMKFKINGGATTYNIEGSVISTTVSLGTARGIVDTKIPISAGTVEEALIGNGDGITSLLQTINETQNELKREKAIDIPNVYSVRFIGDSDLLKNARLVGDKDLDKSRYPMSRADNSKEVNDATGIKAVPDTTRKLIQISNGIPIVQAINNIIKQSSYMSDALKVIFLSSEEPDEDTGSPKVDVKKDVPPIRWYNLSTEVKCLGFDKKVGDFAYDITYVIQPYETPAAASPYTKSSKYYGPHKRYEYWFTGKNSEILSYEQSMDNTYFNVALTPNGDPASQGGGATVPTYPNKKQPLQETQGAIDVGMEAQNAYMTSLYDPGAYARAKITIMGDPDYLAQETPGGINQLYNQFYGTDGFTINPNGGQVFIEIDFKEATDYHNSDGLLSINESIYFWNYPAAVANKVKGVSYMLIDIEHSFKGGKFQQTLTCSINEFPGVLGTPAAALGGRANVTDKTAANTGLTLSKENANNARAAFAATDPRRIDLGGSDVRTGTSEGGEGPTPSSGSTTSSASGYTPDNEFAGVDAAVAANQLPDDMSLFYSSTPNTTTTENTRKGIANDDSVQSSGSTQAGAANAQSPDAGRETQDTTLNTRTRPGEGA